MHTSRHLVTLLIIGILGAVGSGCASGGSGGGAATPSLEGTSNSSASSPTDAPHSPVRPTHDGQPSRTTRPTSATEKLLLPEQVQLQEGGDGLGPSCSADVNCRNAANGLPGKQCQAPPAATPDPGLWPL